MPFRVIAGQRRRRGRDRFPARRGRAGRSTSRPGSSGSTTPPRATSSTSPSDLRMAWTSRLSPSRAIAWSRWSSSPARSPAGPVRIRMVRRRSRAAPYWRRRPPARSRPGPAGGRRRSPSRHRCSRVVTVVAAASTARCWPASAGAARSAMKALPSAATASPRVAPSPAAPCACSMPCSSASRAVAAAAAPRLLVELAEQRVSTARCASPLRSPLVESPSTAACCGTVLRV